MLNTALFIDFDNILINIQRYDPSLAARFVHRPLRWLEALERHLELPDQETSGTRRIISRRCYASPHRINDYRRAFVQAGFEAVDCPPLTSQMKNSADIYIVMDVIDYLTRYPHIDEYVILSADADFAPLLSRLRKELKRSVIFTSFDTASAYRNCADQTIGADFFATHLAIDTAPRQAAAASPPVVQKAGAARDNGWQTVEACLIEAARSRGGRLPFATAAQVLRANLADLMGDDWAGYRTFTALLDAARFETLRISRWNNGEIFTDDFVLDLPSWPDHARERLAEFVTDIEFTASKRIPPLAPGHYAFLFDRLAAYYRAEPTSLADCIVQVAEACRAEGVPASEAEVRFVATGITLRGYSFGADIDPTALASRWREQVFYLCGEPDWMCEAEEAALLAAWLRASTESEEAARDDFLSRTAEDMSPPLVLTEE